MFPADALDGEHKPERTATGVNGDVKSIHVNFEQHLIDADVF
jgi:hypothetical protein